MRTFLWIGLGLLIGAILGAGAVWELQHAGPEPDSPVAAEQYSESLSKHFLFGAPRVTDNRYGVATGCGVGTLYREGFVCAVSYGHKAPLWTAMRWTKADLMRAEKAEVPGRHFKSDEELPLAARAEPDFDFEIEGLDRGHLVPHSCTIAWGEDNCEAGDLMSNVAAQRQALNRKAAWRKLEEFQRRRVTRADIQDKTLWVFTGCVFSSEPKRIANGVAVPSGFFKILVWRNLAGNLVVRAFLFPQEADSDDPLKYATSVDEIEQRAGLNFFPELDPRIQQELEAQVSTVL